MKNLFKYFENRILSRKFRGSRVGNNNLQLSATGRPQLAVGITTIDMKKEEKKKKDNICESVRIGKEPASIKVTNMVGTFLNEDSNGLWIIRVPATKTRPEKVTSMVGTFLNEDINGFQKMSVAIIKAA